LARTFLYEATVARARALFEFLDNLDMSISPGSWKLMVQEIERVRTGILVLPFLDHLGQASTRLEISRLARGYFDDRARNYLGRRESDVRTNLPHTIEDHIAHVAAVRWAKPDTLPKLATFDEAVLRFEPMIPAMLLETLRGQVGVSEAVRLAERLRELPAIRSAVRANIYYSWVCISQGVAPAKDKVDDFRHVIEAAYCGALMTCDRKLLVAISRINPALVPLPGG
jgi:hypothetical protein